MFDDQSFCTSKSEILGALANWAVQQSPYNYPENLPEALFQFENVFPRIDRFETNCLELRQIVRDAFEKCSAILRWNKPKKVDGRGLRSTPDHDYIALDALARNIAHSVTLQAKYNRLNNDEKPLSYVDPNKVLVVLAGGDKACKVYLEGGIVLNVEQGSTETIKNLGLTGE